MSQGEPKGSFVRWQGITIGQLSYAINLILGFSVAALGFQLSLLQSSNFVPSSWGKCVFSISLISLFSSTAFGISVVINRLRDFRLTMRVARKRESLIEEKKSEEEINFELLPNRTKSRKLGNTTWVLFWWQLGTFGIGIFCATLATLATFGKKLL
ncbi:MAG: hypothetical protein PHH47_07460 [Gallionella sp.]|nr:hypothetical protein [Gallionella sp.]MDD4945374.1 hypothetical protein [Gallionella sp.]